MPNRPNRDGVDPTQDAERRRYRAFCASYWVPYATRAVGCDNASPPAPSDAETGSSVAIRLLLGVQQRDRDVAGASDLVAWLVARTHSRPEVIADGAPNAFRKAAGRRPSPRKSHDQALEPIKGGK